MSDDSTDMSDLPDTKAKGTLADKRKLERSIDVERTNVDMAAEIRNKRSKDNNNANDKVYKPSECMKQMIIDIHPVLLESWYCADIPREVTATGARIKTSTALFDPALVMWKTVTEAKLTNVDGTVSLNKSPVYCDRGLYICRAEDIAEYVHSQSLAKHLATVANLSDCKLTLLLFGVKDYFKKSRRKTVNSGRRLMSEIDLEMAITDLLVSADCDTIIVDTPNELALTIVQMTKAIAEAPYKMQKRELDDKAQFYMRGDNKKCVTVDSKGNGLSRLWQQMLAILPLSSLETSRALCMEYKSPSELYKALRGSGGVGALAALRVARAGPGARARRVGPELARKLHALFTHTDGEAVIE